MSYKSYTRINNKRWIAFSQANLAEVCSKLVKDKIALEYYREAPPYLKINHLNEALCDMSIQMAVIFQRNSEPDSAPYFARQSLTPGQNYFFTERQVAACKFLASYYETDKKTDSAFRYLKLSITLTDSLFNVEKQQTIQNLTIDENVRQEELAAQKKTDEANHI